MNPENERVSSPSKPKAKAKTDYLRIQKETKRKILSELANLNRKDTGREVTPDQYISLAISLLTADHLEQLKKQSLSNKDRLEQRYREHCSTHGKISMDEFLGLLLK